jgi:hypothetical protein
MLPICSKTSGGEIPFDTSKIKSALQIVYSANIPLISHRAKANIKELGRQKRTPRLTSKVLDGRTQAIEDGGFTLVAWAQQFEHLVDATCPEGFITCPFHAHESPSNYSALGGGTDAFKSEDTTCGPSTTAP